MKKNDLKDWLENNTLFHDFFSEHCGNKTLTLILDMLKRRIYRYKVIVIGIPGHFDEYISDHEGILKGCENGDGQIAERYMKRHIKRVQKLLIEHLNNFPNF